MDWEVQRMRRGLLLLALGSTLAGCGGHNSIGAGTQTTIEAQIQKGWERTYNVEGFFTPTAGAATVSQGTLVETCTNRVGTQITVTEALQLVVGGVAHNYLTTNISTQAANGSITLVSTTVGANPTLTVQSTTFAIPGTWGSTTNVSGTTTYTDSSSSTDSIVVSGTTQIRTPVGSFDTWTTAYQHAYQGTTDMNLTEFYVPGIAGFAYASGTLLLNDGSFTGTLSLHETNIPIP